MARKITNTRQVETFRAIRGGMGPRRGRGAPVRDSFFRDERDGERAYPLARLLSSRSGKAGGGRGGKTRVALYLSLLWIASGGDHSSNRPARVWAELLGLTDPDGAGSRVVSSTWRELEARHLVTITPGGSGGDGPTVRLLREDGSGAPYTIPTGAGGDTYRRIPEFAWERLFAEEDLTGAGLTMYLRAVRTADRAQRLEGLTFPASHIRDEYGLGESTRKSGLKNLTDLGVLDAHRRRTDDFGDPSQRARFRNTYTLLDRYAPEQRERGSSPSAGDLAADTSARPHLAPDTSARPHLAPDQVEDDPF